MRGAAHLQVNRLPSVEVQTTAGVFPTVLTVLTVAAVVVPCAPLPVIPAGGDGMLAGVMSVEPVGSSVAAITEARAVPLVPVAAVVVRAAAVVAPGVVATVVPGVVAGVVAPVGATVAAVVATGVVRHWE